MGGQGVNGDLEEIFSAPAPLWRRSRLSRSRRTARSQAGRSERVQQLLHGGIRLPALVWSFSAAAIIAQLYQCLQRRADFTVSFDWQFNELVAFARPTRANAISRLEASSMQSTLEHSVVHEEPTAGVRAIILEGIQCTASVADDDFKQPHKDFLTGLWPVRHVLNLPNLFLV